ncbi:hypothetical protein HB904_04225 [Listeria booriae]|uniref:Uncharacterized protein n=1 Tax=Listeria booriae TaxID=1552123 RepID=A0A842AGJ7_9LIST|nr:hypothetical protein [Listeria booriae]MBC1615380.1 hypothetical protein [Listeria booriae]
MMKIYDAGFGEGYEVGMEDAMEIVGYARAQGETDLRQVLAWLNDPEYILEKIREDD